MRGVVAGKFYPPHEGHDFLIRAALQQCDHVDVLVVDNKSYQIPAERRRSWIQAEHPAAHVHIISDIGKDDDSVAWAAHTMQFLGYAPDIVFSSEAYGPHWAKYMGAQHAMVDFERTSVPISGTKVRSDVFAHWQWLGEHARAGLASRVVVVGAESTGTTTLARALAEALRVPWVPEIGRFYTESIITDGGEWNHEDFHRIGRLQQHYEQAIAARSNGVIVCDTNAVATQLWQRRYMGETTNCMKEIAADDIADLYIITGDEIPFVQDGVRDGEHIRHTMHQWFVEYISTCGVPYVVVQGSVRERLTVAKRTAEEIIKQRRTLVNPAC